MVVSRSRSWSAGFLACVFAAALSGCGSSDAAVEGPKNTQGGDIAADSGLITDTQLGGQDIGQVDAPPIGPDIAADSGPDLVQPSCKVDGDCPGVKGPCSHPVCLPGGICAMQGVADASCDDGNACTVGDLCGKGCEPGKLIDCDDKNPCSTDSCDPKAGCVHAANSQPCEDGSVCTEADFCATSKCQPGNAKACGDGNPCTDDSCDIVKGCLALANAATCTDGSACTAGDLCSGGVCLPGAGTSCDDANPCTTDSCDVKLGCVHADAIGGCSDGDVCSQGDNCQGGACVAGKAAVCNDNNPCTDDACDAASGCTATENSAGCSDQNACSQGDSCQGGLCVAGKQANCDDGNPCTIDSCDPAQACVHAAGSQACDDGNACTSGDACSGSACVPGKALICNDSNPCTDDVCDVASGCTFTDSTKACDDNNACTQQDACKAGACVPGIPPVCDDNNLCTTETCDPTQGCKNVPNTLPCDDDDACTSGDVCSGSACVAGAKVVCNDGNPCTNDLCDKGKGCQSTANTAACSDGNVCTSNDTCQGGACLPGTSQGCDDNNACTTDSCDPIQGCVFSANTSPCDDQDVCSQGDTCQASACAPGKAVQCSDGNPCTEDSCDKVKGCQAVNNSAPCSDGSVCTAGDGCKDATCLPGAVTNCDDGNACTADSCHPQTGCQNAPGSNGCDDGSVCTVGDSCQKGACLPGQALDCDDGNACTADACNAQKGCTHGFNSAPCDDGNACTKPDACSGGKCASSSVVCNDGNVCTNDYCDSAKGCQGIANVSACDDSSVCTKADVCNATQCAGITISCDDGNPCTTDSCDKTKGCVNTNVADNTACGIAGLCVAGSCSIGSDLNPATSCKQILDTLGAAKVKDGVYFLDPDGKGPILKFKAFCDMTLNGGGWTLLLKVDGNANTFAYGSGQWFTDIPLKPDSPDLDGTEAKLMSYSTVPFTTLRLGMKVANVTSYALIPAKGTSLFDLIKDGAYKPTTAGRATWKSLLADSSLQLNCNQEGFNTIGCRIGITANQESNCASPDSWLGFGCYNDVVGNYAVAAWSPDNGGKDTKAFGYILAR